MPVYRLAAPFGGMPARFPLLVKESADYCAKVAGSWLKLPVAGR